MNDKIPHLRNGLETYIDPLSKEILDTAEEQRELAIRDGLTGLYNRAYSIEQARILATDTHKIQSVTVLFFDIDDMKEINDSNGHSAGDEAICKVAQAIQENSRSGDIPCRYGGDEYIVFLPNTDNEHDVDTIINRFKDTLNSLEISVSMGYSTIKRSENGILDLTEALSVADDKLYHQKAVKSK